MPLARTWYPPPYGASKEGHALHRSAECLPLGREEILRDGCLATESPAPMLEGRPHRSQHGVGALDLGAEWRINGLGQWCRAWSVVQGHLLQQMAILYRIGIVGGNSCTPHRKGIQGRPVMVAGYPRHGSLDLVGFNRGGQRAQGGPEPGLFDLHLILVA